MNTKAEVLALVKSRIADAVFLAEVTDTAGGLVEIQRLENTTPDGQMWPKLAGYATPVAGDVVLCVDISVEDRNEVIVIDKLG